MSRIRKPPKSRVDNIVFLIEQWEEMVRRQDARTGRQILTDDTKRAIMMDICPAEFEKHLLLNCDRYDTYPKVKSAIRDYIEHTRHKSDPRGVNDMSHNADEEYDAEWEEVYAVGNCTGKAKETPRARATDLPKIRAKGRPANRTVPTGATAAEKLDTRRHSAPKRRRTVGARRAFTE